MKKGFTLIEMAVVLLIIGILAGIVLRNIGGQSAIARDTRRIGDLRNVANYLSTYMAKYGFFPLDTTWTDLENTLRTAGIADRLPSDPQGKTGALGYNYYPCSDSGIPDPSNPANHFILRAQLEETQTQAPRLYETSVTSTPTGWSCAGAVGSICDVTQRYYCIAQ